MKIKKITAWHKEVIRYMENAKDILRKKAKKRDDFYHCQDAPHVSTACGTAYKALLFALDACLELKGKPIKVKNNRKNADDYRRALSDDRKMLNYYNVTWEALRCS